MVETLLDRGADPLYAPRKEKSALHLVVDSGLLAIMRRLMAKVHEPEQLPLSLLHETACREESNLEMMKFLLELRVDINAQMKTNKLVRLLFNDKNNVSVGHLLAIAEY